MLAGSSFHFDVMSANNVARETAGPPADTLAEFREHLNDTTSPPGPLEAMVGEVVIHGADIRRPLAIAHRYPQDALIRVADFFRGSNLLIGAKRRINGVTLRATDADWSTGSGAEVTGPFLSLILAMTGRSAALADLSGDGVATLSSRKLARSARSRRRARPDRRTIARPNPDSETAPARPRQRSV